MKSLSRLVKWHKHTLSVLPNLQSWTSSKHNGPDTVRALKWRLNPESVFPISGGQSELLNQTQVHAVTALLCVSGHGRNFLLLMFVSLLVSGPLSNTLENTERAASSLLCGAELAANQTQELMQKAATPLFCKPRPHTHCSYSRQCS